jgi:hypothetical protein
MGVIEPEHAHSCFCKYVPKMDSAIMYNHRLRPLPSLLHDLLTDLDLLTLAATSMVAAMQCLIQLLQLN